MDFEFKRITFDRIRSLADECRAALGASGIPVDIERLIEIEYKIDIVPWPNLKAECDIEAFINKELTTIFINNSTYLDPRFDSRMRFTLAHELGHKILHSDFYACVDFATPEEWIGCIQEFPEEDVNWYEIHADEFAGRLLVPREILMEKLYHIRPEINDRASRAQESEIDQEQLTQALKGFASTKLHRQFRVAPKTIEYRIHREKINLLNL